MRHPFVYWKLPDLHAVLHGFPDSLAPRLIDAFPESFFVVGEIELEFVTSGDGESERPYYGFAVRAGEAAHLK
jgi:hypothetical protein